MVIFRQYASIFLPMTQEQAILALGFDLRIILR